MEVYLNQVEKEIKNLGGKIGYAHNAFEQFCGRAMFEFKYALGKLVEGKDYTGHYSVATLFVYFRKNDFNQVEFSVYDKHICMTLSNSNFDGSEKDGQLIRISLFQFLDKIYKDIYTSVNETLWRDGLLDRNNIYHKDKQFSELLNKRKIDYDDIDDTCFVVDSYMDD